MGKIDRIVSRFLPSSNIKPMESPMYFLAGPRQVGKTFLTRSFDFPYYNWDTSEVTRSWLKDRYFFRTGAPWVIFDEIHKRRDWKKQLKGYFDSPTRNENFLVTGSGRFNLTQRGGDSLQGRYDLYHLLPILYREYVGLARNFELKRPVFVDAAFSNKAASDNDLFKFGGFPEPLLKMKESALNKWQDLYIQRLIQEDVRDFSKVTKLDKLELLVRLLPERIRSPISVNSLSNDIEVSRDSVTSWLRLLEILYLTFSISPFTTKVHRAVKKEKKLGFFQWTFCENQGDRFENYVATQLYSLCQLWRDAGFGTYELCYLRDQDRREVDFVITKSLKPVALIEAKIAETQWPSSLDFYANKLQVPSFVVTAASDTKRISPNKWITSSSRFFDFLS
jgi:predicted AAA+ superfamily ATPase